MCRIYLCLNRKIKTHPHVHLNPTFIIINIFGPMCPLLTEFFCSRGPHVSLLLLLLQIPLPYTSVPPCSPPSSLRFTLFNSPVFSFLSFLFVATIEPSHVLPRPRTGPVPVPSCSRNHADRNRNTGPVFLH